MLLRRVQSLCACSPGSNRLTTHAPFLLLLLLLCLHVCRYEEFQQAEQAQQQLVHTMCVAAAAPPSSSSSSSSSSSTGPAPAYGMAPAAAAAAEPAVLWTCTGNGSAFIYNTADGSLLRKVRHQPSAFCLGRHTSSTHTHYSSSTMSGGRGSHCTRTTLCCRTATVHGVCIMLCCPVLSCPVLCLCRLLRTLGRSRPW
jgi:hypothetical protein